MIRGGRSGYSEALVRMWGWLGARLGRSGALRGDGRSPLQG